MNIAGRAHCFGDDINTDYIIASKYKTASLDPRDLTRHLMEDIDPGFGQRTGEINDTGLVGHRQKGAFDRGEVGGGR